MLLGIALVAIALACAACGWALHAQRALARARRDGAHLQDILDNIPVGMYWAIVTMTTVGFGDIAPQTPPGQFLAAILMLMGYGIIAVPTGIVGAEIAKASRGQGVSTQACPVCSAEGHDADADFCKFCGGKL